MKKGRVFSGARPSGRQHIGNYLGAIQNYVALQEEYSQCIYSAVDIHALTTINDDYSTREMQSNIREMILDFLAAGLDPNRSIIFAQSHVPEVLTLHALLSMLTPMGWLMRVPTFKDKVRQMDQTEETVSYGLVGYPVLMTADIILYKANVVPVGQDQIPHIELAREIVRRFNNLFGPTFPEPQAKHTEVKLVVGLDGFEKMSKSLDNHIELSSSKEDTTRRVLTAFTDPERQRKSDKGRPWVCNVYSLHKHFNPKKLDYIYNNCTSASIGCVDCKKLLADGISDYFESFREFRAELASRPNYVREVLADGASRARVIAKETLSEVLERMSLLPADVENLTSKK